MDKEEEKKKQIDQIHQHNLALWKALNLSYPSQNIPDSFDKNQIKKEINQKFHAIEIEIQSASLSEPPSVKILQNHTSILDAYVPKEKQKECLAILDKYNQFTYPNGYFKRSIRCTTHWGLLHDFHLERIFTSYYNLSFYASSMSDYYKYPEKWQQLEKLLGSHSCPSILCKEDLIAAELDARNTDLSKILENILMSENNTNIISMDIVRGIIKSSNSYLHKLLGDFLFMAQLQESVQQVVCENMVCGTIEAFFTLFHVITENNLICFPNVKRAICNWTGLWCNNEYFEQIATKQFDLIKQSLNDRTFCEELTQSDNRIEFYIGLWTLGFFEIEDAITCCKERIETGTKNQKLVISYYNLSWQQEKFTMQIASQILETYPKDIELCAAFLPTYMSQINQVLQGALYGNNPISCHTFFLEETQAKKHFSLWNDLYLKLPKKELTYSFCIFPWYHVSITPAQIISRMAMLAYILQKDKLIDQVCPLISEIGAYQEDYLCLLLHNPKTNLQRQTLLQALTNKHSRIRSKAFHLLSNLKLEERDCQQLTYLLKYKSNDIRKHILSLLEQQTGTILLSSITTLLSSKKETMRLGGLELLIRLKKEENRKEDYQTCCILLHKLKNPTEKEAIILAELTSSH